MLSKIEEFLSQRSFEPSWLQHYRRHSYDKFLKRGIPTQREEKWRYTDLSFLKKEDWHFNYHSENKNFPKIPQPPKDVIQFVFCNGYYQAQLSTLTNLPSDIIACDLKEAFQKYPNELQSYLMREIDATEHPLALLNAALQSDGVFLRIPKNVIVKFPIKFLFINFGSDAYYSNIKNIFIADESSSVEIIEEYISDNDIAFLTQINTEIYAGENSKINYSKIQNENKKSLHLANILVHQKKDSFVKTVAIGGGAIFSREDWHFAMQAKGASCVVNGFYHPNCDNQYMDYHIQIDHLTEQTQSEIFFKGILEKKSQAVFNGKVFVHPHAKNTYAQQSNHTLILSPTAIINTKPELEIYNDDVKCTHGATIGQLNPDMMFYFRARGIPYALALKYMTHAFADEIIQKINNPLITAYFAALLGNLS